MNNTKMVDVFQLIPTLALSTCILGCVAIAAKAIAAAEPDNTTFSDASDFEESLQPTRPVSGDLIAGFAGSDQGSVKPLRVEAWVPMQWRGMIICAMIRSRDGRYEAYKSFNVPPYWESAYQVFNFEEAREEQFLASEVSQLATSVHLGICGADILESAVAYWGGRSGETEREQRIFLNSMRAEEASIYFYSDSEELLCAAIEAADRQVFDFVCEVSDKAGPQRIEINRIRRGNYDSASEHVLYFPSESP